MISDTTSVTARAACICFCAMRPAKSSSKNPTVWPSVHLCKRDNTKGFTLGCTMIELDADDRPNSTGRAIRKNANAPSIRAVLFGSKNPSGPSSAAESITMPRMSAVPTSNVPARAEKNAANHKAGQAPDRHQRIKAPSVCGGGPSAGRKAFIQLAIFTHRPQWSGTRPIDAPRTQHIARPWSKARRACHLLRYGPDP